MSENDLSQKDMPWQFRAIGFIGIPGTLAIWLVYVLTTSISGEVKRASETQIQNQEILQSILKEMQGDRDENRAKLDSLRLVITAECINDATNQAARERCLGTRPLVQ